MKPDNELTESDISFLQDMIVACINRCSFEPNHDNFKCSTCQQADKLYHKLYRIKYSFAKLGGQQSSFDFDG